MTDNEKAVMGRVAKLENIFLAAQEWYGTVRGHLTYDNLGNCVNFGGLKPEAASLVRALDAYHVWSSLTASPEPEKPCVCGCCIYGVSDANCGSPCHRGPQAPAPSLPREEPTKTIGQHGQLQRNVRPTKEAE